MIKSLCSHSSRMALCLAGVLLCLVARDTVNGQTIPRARPEAVGMSSKALSELHRTLQAFIDSGKLAGIVVAVARHGKLVYLDSIGLMNIAAKTAMRTDAAFRVYSMTKPIATVAVMQLVERGKVRLDDPVSRYLPAFASVQVYSGGGSKQPRLVKADRPITIEHLLTHTAGLTYGTFGNTPVDSIYLRRNVGHLDPAGRYIAHADWTLAQFVDTIAHMPLMFQPGTSWNYSFGIDVLSRVVEVVSGKSFDRYVQDEVLAPLGMRMTSFHATPAMDGRIATMYTKGPNGKLLPDPELLLPEFRPEGRIYFGGSGLLSTVSDYLRFCQMLLNGGELEGHRILARTTVDQMLKNHLPSKLLLDMGGWPPGTNGFGFGGAVRVDTVAKAPGNAGTLQWAGYGSTYFWIDPSADLIGMVWTQFVPSFGTAWLDNETQRLVYSAIVGR